MMFDSYGGAIGCLFAVRIDPVRIAATIDAALVEHTHHKASMLQDRAHRRQTGIETINDAIAREGTRLGVPASICDTLTDLARSIELTTQ